MDNKLLIKSAKFTNELFEETPGFKEVCCELMEAIEKTNTTFKSFGWDEEGVIDMMAGQLMGNFLSICIKNNFPRDKLLILVGDMYDATRMELTPDQVLGKENPS